MKDKCLQVDNSVDNTCSVCVNVVNQFVQLYKLHNNICVIAKAGIQ